MLQPFRRHQHHLNQSGKSNVVKVAVMGTASKSYQFNLGTYHRKVTTANAEAQVWFDRGLIWSYAFHHEESARCFEKAIAEDPGCAMAYWGVSLKLKFL